MLAAVGWPDVVLALIVAPPAYLAAWASFRVRQEVKMSDGKTLGSAAEQTQTIVTRTLGERKTDGAKPFGLPDAHKRSDDGEV